MIVLPDYRWERIVWRFWERVDKRGDDECWPWRGRVATKGGHGVWEPSDGKPVPAHRSSYLIANGLRARDIAGCPVRQSCGDKLCVNPAHLVLGEKWSHLKKGRLTDEQVQLIRAQAQAGRLQSEIAEEFGIAQGMVSRIVARKSYKHVADAQVTIATRPHRRSKVASPTESLIETLQRTERQGGKGGDERGPSLAEILAAELAAGEEGAAELRRKDRPGEFDLTTGA